MTLSSNEIAILIVDDNLINRNNMRQQLQRLMPNLLLDEAGNGLMAVELCQQFIQRQQKNYNIIVMDFCMPIMDGETATNQIRDLEQQAALTAATRSFIITWSNARCTAYRAADAVLHKPIIQKQLETLFANYLDR